MTKTISIPADFCGVVITSPPTINSATLPMFQQNIKAAKLDQREGHRILHMHQVEVVDSAAVAGLVDGLTAVTNRGAQFVVCDPPPIVRSYMEVYGAAPLLEGRVLSSANDGTYQTELMPFVPPFVPNPRGRVDVYENGEVHSFEFSERGLKEVDAVDLSEHPPKVPTRARNMEVQTDSGEREEVTASGYVHIRRHNCGCSATHETFRKIHKLHDWIRKKGFDFQNLELWASDVPAGMVMEKMTFRDPLHYDQFQTLLKIDSSWKAIGASTENIENEFYYAY